MVYQSHPAGVSEYSIHSFDSVQFCALSLLSAVF